MKMPKQMPPYETIVRWTVKDVVDWLKEVGLGEFKEHITRHNIDGNKLASLSEFDVNNFVGKPKKKTELQNYIYSIKKPKNTQSRPWNPPPTPQPASNSKNGYESDDSIYSWGDEFSDEDDAEDDDDGNYIDIDNSESVSNIQKQEELYEEPQINSDTSIISSLKSALSEFHAKRGPSPSRFTQDDTEPESGPDRPPLRTPGQRPPPSIATQRPPQPKPSAAPLLPGQIIPTATSKKNIPKPLMPAEPQSKPPRRAPPPPPPDSPDVQEQEYFNQEEIDAERNQLKAEREKKNSRTDTMPIPALSDDGYMKYNPNNQEIYIDPDEDEKPAVPANRNNRPPLPSIPSPKETKSIGHKTSLPPVPKSSSRRTSHPELPSRKISQPDQVDGMSSFEWYHDDLERGIAEARLKEYNYDGMFLVRRSLKGGNVHPYTLMVFYQSKVFNFPVRKRDLDGKFALGKKDSPDDVAFDTVDALIQNYQKVNMILQGTKGQGWTAKLTKPLSK